MPSITNFYKRILMVLMIILFSDVSGVCGEFDDTLKKAKQGYMRDEYNLAVLYENGQGTSVNKKKAINWYTKAAEQGFAQAQYRLARFYWKGDGVPVDMQKYLELLTKSANQGNMMAQFRLGVFFSEGENATNSDSITKSIGYYTKAAKQDHTESQMALSLLYWSCQELSDCRMKAYIWCALAKEKNPEATEDFLELIANTMTTREISTAQSAASIVKGKINKQ